MDKGKAIGIDLGTTYSCVAALQNDRIEIIVNEQGNRTTPSMVAFTPFEGLVGEAAKNQVSTNPQNTVFDAKRLIGRRFNDPCVKSDMIHWPFTVVEGNNGQPIIQVEYKGETKRFAAQEISSLILMKMKRIAKESLGCEVKKAVITVPAYFNNAQRKATKDAAKVAYGAAVQAAALNKEKFNIALVDVTPLSLGIESFADVMSVMVPRNTALPTRKEQIFRTLRDNQTGVNVNVYEGERALVSDNNLLGKFVLSGIPAAPSGRKIKVVFEVDLDGILKASAQDEGSGVSDSITIDYESDRLSTEEIQRMLREAQKFRRDDEEARKRSIAKSNLEAYIYNIRSRRNEGSGNRGILDLEIAALWLEETENPDVDEMEEKLKALKLKCGDSLD